MTQSRWISRGDGRGSAARVIPRARVSRPASWGKWAEGFAVCEIALSWLKGQLQIPPSAEENARTVGMTPLCFVLRRVSAGSPRG
jgi:hypothetical protein